MVTSRQFDFASRKTVSRSIDVQGVGLHSGRRSSVNLVPSVNGIEVLDAGAWIAVSDIAVVQTPRCTRLSLPSGRCVDMVEHLMAALRIAGISDVGIEFVGDEVPVLDGSSAVWLEAFASAGVSPLGSGADLLVVTTPMDFSVGMSTFSVKPGRFSLDCSIDFPNPFVGCQSVSVDEAGLPSLALARTFVLEHEIAMLKANNLALGGSLDNAVVIGADGPLNDGGFRFRDECVRHKALDFVGDMMVAGFPIVGAFEIHAPGHSANNQFLLEMVRRDVLRRVTVHDIDAVALETALAA